MRDGHFETAQQIIESLREHHIAVQSLACDGDRNTCEKKFEVF